MAGAVFLDKNKGEKGAKGGRKVDWLMKAAHKDSEHTSVCTAVFEPHQRAMPAHSHTNAEETIYIVSGDGKALIGDEIYLIVPGSLIFMPRGVPHMLWNTGDTQLKGICFYAPAQEEIVYFNHEEIDFPEFQSSQRG